MKLLQHYAEIQRHSQHQKTKMHFEIQAVTSVENLVPSWNLWDVLNQQQFRVWINKGCSKLSHINKHWTYGKDSQPPGRKQTCQHLSQEESLSVLPQHLYPCSWVQLPLSCPDFNNTRHWYHWSNTWPASSMVTCASVQAIPYRGFSVTSYSLTILWHMLVCKGRCLYFEELGRASPAHSCQGSSEQHQNIIHKQMHKNFSFSWEQNLCSVWCLPL